MSVVSMHVILADVHYPVHSREAVLAVLDFIRQNKSRIASVTLLGDAMDCGNVSRHTKARPRLRQRGGIKREIDGFVRDILEPIQCSVKSSCKLTYVEGNHEAWLENSFLDENPEWEGVCDLPVLLKLEERGWKWIPQGGHLEIGRVVLMHGDQIGSGISVTKKLVDSVCATSIMGHVHSFSAYTKVSAMAKKRKWAGYTLPCLCTVAPSYAKGKPNAFIQGFGIIESYGKSGYGNIYVPLIFNGKFSYGGKIYGK